MLKRILDKVDDLPEGVRALYKQRNDGKWILDVEDDPELKGKLDEFRTNNIQMKRDLEALQETLKGIDLDEYKNLKATQEKLKDKKLIDEGKIDELIETRTQKMRKDHENQVVALTKANDELAVKTKLLQERLQTTQVESSILSAVNKFAVPKEGAIPDILARASKDWRLDEKGNLVCMTGDQIIYGKDGRTPISVEEYSEGFVKAAAHLFGETKGLGSQGGGNGGPRGKVDAETWKTLSDSEKMKAGREAAAKR